MRNTSALFEFEELFKGLRELVSHFKRSTKSKEKLELHFRQNNMVPMKLVRDVPIRYRVYIFCLFVVLFFFFEDGAQPTICWILTCVVALSSI